MAFQKGSVIEVPKEYVLLVTNNSQTLLCGGQMSCNKYDDVFWSSNKAKETPPLQIVPPQTQNVDMDAWAKNYVRCELFTPNTNNKTIADSTATANLQEQQSDMNKNNLKPSVDIKVDTAEENPVIETECTNDDEGSDTPKVTSCENDVEIKQQSNKKKFKVFKLVKKAIKKHFTK